MLPDTLGRNPRHFCQKVYTLPCKSVYTSHQKEYTPATKRVYTFLKESILSQSEEYTLPAQRVYSPSRKVSGVWAERVGYSTGEGRELHFQGPLSSTFPQKHWSCPRLAAETPHSGLAKPRGRSRGNGRGVDGGYLAPRARRVTLLGN